jgi:hypothetical protein
MHLPGWIGRDDREPAALPGVIILADGSQIPVTITDVSDNGCRVDCTETLPIKTTVQLQVGSERLAAEVRWALPGAAGLQILRT